MAVINKEWYITMISLASLYSLLTIGAVISLYRSLKYFKNKPLGWRLPFHIFLFMASLIRTVFFLFLAFANVLKIPVPIVSFLSGIAAFFYTSMFILLVLFWADIYNKRVAAKQESKKLRIAFYTLQGVCYTTYCILTTVNIIQFHDTDADMFPVVSIFSEIFAASCLSLLALAASSATIFYYYRLNTTFKNEPSELHFIERVGWITVLCTFFFLARVFAIIMTIVSIIISDDSGNDLNNNWIFLLCFYIIFDIMPISLMMFLLHWSPSSSNSNRRNTKNLTASSDSPLVQKPY